jgi:hypothetical protein
MQKKRSEKEEDNTEIRFKPMHKGKKLKQNARELL